MKKKLLIAVSVVALVILSATAIILFDVFGVTGSDNNVTVTVTEGETFRSVLVKLKEEKVILNDKVFLAYLKIKGIEPQISYGDFSVASSMSYDEVLDALSGYSYREGISVTIPSAANVDEIAAILESKGICSKSSFINAAKGYDYSSELLSSVTAHYRVTYKAEGFLFPETYTFYENDDPERVLGVMLSQTDSVVTFEMLARAEELGLTVNEFFTFASIVEAECCGYYDDMPKVAKIFWNRLNDWGEDSKLQSDPTRVYPYNTKYYDTYEIGGLPIGPICNVSLAAMEAVLYPSEELDNYYFFVTDTNVQFYYNQTDAQHEQTIESLKRQGLWE